MFPIKLKKNLRTHFIRNLAFSAEELIFTYPLIGTSQNASHTVRHIERNSIPYASGTYMDIVTYPSLHSS